MTRLETETMGLKGLLRPPFSWHWWPYVKARAAEIAAEDPTCLELPTIVAAEYQRLKESSLQARSTALNSTPSAQPTTAAAVATPAHGLMPRSKGSTGSPAS